MSKIKDDLIDKQMEIDDTDYGYEENKKLPKEELVAKARARWTAEGRMLPPNYKDNDFALTRNELARELRGGIN